MAATSPAACTASLFSVLILLRCVAWATHVSGAWPRCSGCVLEDVTTGYYFDHGMDKRIVVVDFAVYKHVTCTDAQLIYAAAVLAKYLDNDEDGFVDDPKILEYLLTNPQGFRGVAIVDRRGIFPDEFKDSWLGISRPYGETVDQLHQGYNDQVPTMFQLNVKEEFNHALYHAYGEVYRKDFGPDATTGIMQAFRQATGNCELVDECYPNCHHYKCTTDSRDCQFIPGSCDGVYHYGIVDCISTCRTSEFFWWGWGTMNGLVLQACGREYDVCTKEEMMNHPKIALLRDLVTNKAASAAQLGYMLPASLPAGIYDPAQPTLTTTVSPAAVPTASPKAAVTGIPTMLPTAAPIPTVAPVTSPPTASPKAVVTGIPTTLATATPIPTAAPVTSPTVAPTRTAPVPTESPTTLPTASFTGPGLVSVKFTITVVDFHKLTEGMKNALSEKVADGIAADTAGVSSSDVNVILSAGSLNVDATITVLSGIAEDIRSSLMASTTFASRIIQSVKHVPDIHVATTGMLSADTITYFSADVHALTTSPTPSAQLEARNSDEGNAALGAGEIVAAIAIGLAVLCCCFAVATCCYRKRRRQEIPTRMAPSSSATSKASSRSKARGPTASTPVSHMKSGASEASKSGKQMAPELSLPNWKSYHFFLSCEQPVVSELGTHVRRRLERKGLAGSVADDLGGQREIEHLVKSSCVLVAILGSESCASEGCRFQWDAARKFEVPVLCVLDVSDVGEDRLIAEVSRVNSHLLEHPWVHYTKQTQELAYNACYLWVRAQVEEQLSQNQDVQDQGPRSVGRARGNPSAASPRSKTEIEILIHQTRNQDPRDMHLRLPSDSEPSSTELPRVGSDADLPQVGSDTDPTSAIETGETCGTVFSV